MKNTIPSLRLFLTVPLLLSAIYASAQCDTASSRCARELTPKYISDGQEYRSFLVNDEVAEFHSTFYAGSTYRIVAGSGSGSGNIIFRIYDKDKNILFNSAQFNNPSSWDFKFTSTLNCTIETQLAPEAKGSKPPSNCAVMLIGFKN